jgi:hypothetical protein
VDTMVGTMDTIDWIDGIVRALGVKNYTQLTTLVCSKPKKDVIGIWRMALRYFVHPEKTVY